MDLRVRDRREVRSNPSGLERDLAPDGPFVRNRLDTPPLVVAWWAMFIITGVLGNFVLQRVLDKNSTLADYRRLSWAMILVDLLQIPSAVLAVVVVRRVTAWQSERAARVLEVPPEMPAQQEPVPTGW